MSSVRCQFRYSHHRYSRSVPTTSSTTTITTTSTTTAPVFSLVLSPSRCLYVGRGLDTGPQIPGDCSESGSVAGVAESVRWCKRRVKPLVSM
ncbi:hypothetical protein E2C01_039461 [Portunus trituberculatus]|uniref:Uncharacterized protein n=1 Tax=Portunus trituberculatus TaxID=210409 RepID=A0A5B7FJS7_PORTR|nr:hypothetical protein [Portunus trituberculatus]